jgi:hypothetical protein
MGQWFGRLVLHHISVPMLRMAFYALKRDAPPGVDGLTWQDYEADLDRRIEDLHDRVQRGAYRAQPPPRRYIPKPDGRQRSLAVAAREDKIAQRAVVAVLDVIYEEEFLGFSYGLRPGRSQHEVLDALVVGIGSTQVNRALQTFRDCAMELRQRSPRRRGQRDKTTWERIKRLADDDPPKPHILHPWPEQRFGVRYPRWEPYAGIPLVRFCAGRARQSASLPRLKPCRRSVRGDCALFPQSAHRQRHVGPRQQLDQPDPLSLLQPTVRRQAADRLRHLTQ